MPGVVELAFFFLLITSTLAIGAAFLATSFAIANRFFGEAVLERRGWANTVLTVFVINVLSSLVGSIAGEFSLERTDHLPATIVAQILATAVWLGLVAYVLRRNHLIQPCAWTPLWPPIVCATILYVLLLACGVGIPFLLSRFV